MELRDTQRSAELQQSISNRLIELGYAESEGAQRFGREIAEVLVTAHHISTNLLPLFLEIDRSNSQSLGAVAIALKVELETMTDALVDLENDLPDWSEFFTLMSERGDGTRG